MIFLQETGIPADVPSHLKYYVAGVFLLVLLIFIIIKFLTYLKDKKKIAEKLQYSKDQIIKVHMISETAYVTQGQGVHTAYIECMELLANDKNIIIKVNGEGTGNIFHSHTYGPYYFWKGRNYKGRRILTAHVIPDSSKGTIPFWKQLLPLTTLYLKLAYSYADVVIAISPTVEKEIRRLGIKSKIVRIYNPVLLDNWARTEENRKKGRQQLGIKDHEKLVLGVGQLQERKGVEDFIDIAAGIPESKFVWAGGRPWGMFTEGIKRIDERIEKAPSNISFTGLLDLKEMAPMYAAADVFLFPSYQENCPLAPMEAAASGLPVVFRDIQEYTSLYANPYLKAANTAEFIEITRTLLSDRPFYNEGVKISERLISEFDKFKIKNDLISLYTNVLNNYFNISS
ncbi:MAG: 1,2-diacylglycerol-3-alpha-glucose alpha,2-galactosyltransferase [Mucilaginibacter sp.]|nr:1,2-diacylglycerol-3-alpha-glucose alpha,2-galactosyltransferase [Mucilaginibacter sp.]